MRANLLPLLMKSARWLLLPVLFATAAEPKKEKPFTRYRNIWVRPLHRYDENAKK